MIHAHFRCQMVLGAMLAVLLCACACEKGLQQIESSARGDAPEPARTEDAASQLGSPAGGDGPLQLRISTPKATIVQCEPLPVKFELKNVSAKSVTVDLALAPGYGEVLLVYITPPHGERYGANYPTPVSDARLRDIHPRESVTHGRLLHHHFDRGFLFKRPGQYRIDAIFDDGSSRAESNTLILTVNEAKGVDAKALDEYFDANPHGYFMMGATSAANDHLIGKDFEAILEKYPASAYAPWCEIALVQAHSIRAEYDRWLRKQFRAESPSALTKYAIKQYEGFLQTHADLPFPYSVHMPYTVARMKLAIGRKEEALREIDALIKEHPEVDFIKEAAFRIEAAKAEGREVREGGLPP